MDNVYAADDKGLSIQLFVNRKYKDIIKQKIYKIYLIERFLKMLHISG